MLLPLLLNAAVASATGSPAALGTAGSALPRFLTDPSGTEFHVVGSHIVDGHGRQRFFHGTNVVHKLFPFHPRVGGPFDTQQSFVKEDMELLYELGVNAIRLNVAWAAAEPEDGVWNTTFLDVVEGIVNDAGKYGMFSLLDHHQDAFSTKVCGTGFPSWTVADTDDKWVYKHFLGKHAHFPEPVDTAFDLRGLGPVEIRPGQPNETLCKQFIGKKPDDFPLLHATFQTSLSYEEMYDNVKGKLDRWAAYWSRIATRFGGNARVLGFELSNEPFSGDFYSHPFNLLPWNADRNRLQGVFDRLAMSVRSSGGEKTLVFFQSVSWEVEGISELVGFDHAPGGAQYANKSVLSYHCSVDEKLAPQPEYFDWRDKEAQRLRVASLLTETNLEGSLALADAYARNSLAGWLAWDYKRFANWTWDNCGLFHCNCDHFRGVDDCINTEMVTRYTRVYPQAVAGVLESMSFDPGTGDANVTYRPDYSITEPTVVFVPSSVHYPSGFEVQVLPVNCASWDLHNTTRSTYVSIQAKRDFVPTGGVITVKFRRQDNLGERGGRDEVLQV